MNFIFLLEFDKVLLLYGHQWCQPSYQNIIKIEIVSALASYLDRYAGLVDIKYRDTI